jgi:hypothetical protein
MSTGEVLKKYGLEPVEVRKIDLRNTYTQCTPARPLDDLFGGTGLMVDSPHLEFAKLYYEHGLKWMKKKYKTTRFCLFRAKLGKRGFSSGMVTLCNSIKRGYLHGKYSSDYVIVLNTPFCNSRYNLEKDINRVPEIFSGHHRVGALLALEEFFVPVLFCVDGSAGSCFSLGKIHAACGGKTQ